MNSLNQRQLLKNSIGGIVGNIPEWYDFAVFGFLAPIMGGLSLAGLLLLKTGRDRQLLPVYREQ